ncbi:MAG TPA: tripartite tricarboxylate transporter substrate binding protein [Xanthobacteraceae bacterium]|nr:tripartite tricarboxylate transporter substrate binding protein [Xanthobacteraceae bacterium]
MHAPNARLLTIGALCAAALVLLPAPLSAQEWPQKSVKVIVPLAPGGAADLVMRAVGEEFTANTKQAVILENRPGGGGTLAAETVMRSPADGYTLLMGNSAIFGVTPHLVKKINYDPINDFTPITTFVELPIVLVVNNDVPANNVAEFIDYAKKNPGKLSFGSSGYGTTMHLAGELLNERAGIQMTHIPYKGGAPALVDVLSGQIPVVMAALSTVAPHIGGGKVKVLATVESKRSASHPDIPTVGETLPGYAVPASWLGVLGPAGLPEPVTAKMLTEFLRATNAPNVQAMLKKNGFDMLTRSGADLGREIKEDFAVYGKIFEAARITPQ